MSTNWDIVTPLLDEKLDPKHVSKRSQAGFQLSYIEGWHAIAEANRIFGYGNWYRETIYCKEVCRYDYNGKQKVGYEAKVRITVLGEVWREGTGHGSGIAKDLFDAIEGAAKEAETDAMKRALMTFGNKFGLALYDKTQANVGVTKESAAARNRRFKKIKDEIEAAEDLEELKQVWADNQEHIKEFRQQDEVFFTDIEQAKNKRIEFLESMIAVAEGMPQEFNNITQENGVHNG